MKEVDTIAVHRFGRELLVELIGVDEHGDVASETIEFDLVHSDNETVTPREAIPADYEEDIWTALCKKGYSLSETNA